MAQACSYRDWHIPLARDGLSLGQAVQSLHRVGARAQAIPLWVRLVENPRYHLPGIRVFHGAVDLQQHDMIHIVLGRGLLAMDEAFTIGFTMGSTNRVSALETHLFSFIARFLYPRAYRLGSRELTVFRDALYLGHVSGCIPFDRIDFTAYATCTLRELRREIGLESDLLRAYYHIEQRRYPDSRASRRLLDH